MDGTRPRFVPAAAIAHSAPRQRRKDARPRELLEAALAVFVEKGFAAARTDDVAQRAGVSKGTLYLYYPSKTELLKAVIAVTLGDEIESARDRVEAHRGPASELIQGFILEWCLALYESPASGVFKIVVTEARNFPEVAEFYAQKVIQPGMGLLTRVVNWGVESGEFDVPDVQHAAFSLFLPVLMACIHKNSLGACGTVGDLLNSPAFIRDHFDLMVRSFTSRTKGPKGPHALLGASVPQGDLSPALKAAPT